MTDNEYAGILSLIKTDHQEVADLFQQFEENVGSQEAETIFKQIYTELSLHAHAEELVFYPAMMEYDETKRYIEEAESEHNSLKILLEQMRSLKFTDPEFEVKFKYIKETMLHHVDEEEEEIFPAVQQCMDGEILESLAQEFEQAKVNWEKDIKVAVARK